jgi:hypothetical protein
MSKTWVYVTQYLDSTPLTLDEDNAATEEAPLPLAILALMVMAIIGLAVGCYLICFTWARLGK